MGDGEIQPKEAIPAFLGCLRFKGVGALSDVEFVDEHEAAAMLDMSVKTLRCWRSQRQGPAFIKMGRSVKYAISDLRAYVARRRIETATNSRSEMEEPNG